MRIIPKIEEHYHPSGGLHIKSWCLLQGFLGIELGCASKKLWLYQHPEMLTVRAGPSSAQALLRLILV